MQGQKSGSAPLTDEMIEIVARQFRLLGEPIRLRLIQLLDSSERSVNELTVALQGNQPNISRHLTALYEGGLLRRRRDGNSIYYSIADPVVFQLFDLVSGSARQQIQIKLKALGKAAS
jgi:DNA-binding transcriptional ArsR family regulator